MKLTPSETLAKILLSPVVKLCLKRGVLLQQLVNIIKMVYVETAEAELRQVTPKINVSRISVMTGVHRLDVGKIFKDREPLRGEEPITLIGKVASEWTHQRKYCSAPGRPKVLSFEGEDCEFFKLARSISQTVNPATILFEMIRNGMVKKTPKGLRLVRETRALTSDEQKAYEFLARDMEYLTEALEENLNTTPEKLGNLHHRTEYDNIYLEDLPKIRRWILQHGREFHQAARRFISRFDKDLSPRARPDSPSGGRVHLSAFSFIEPRE